MATSSPACLVLESTAPSAPAPAYTVKVDALLERAVELGFTEHDFIDLALAAVDQSAASSKVYTKVAGLLDPCQCDSCLAVQS